MNRRSLLRALVGVPFAAAGAAASRMLPAGPIVTAGVDVQADRFATLVLVDWGDLVPYGQYVEGQMAVIAQAFAVRREMLARDLAATPYAAPSEARGA